MMKFEFSKDDLKVSDWNLAEEIETAEDVIGMIDAALEENDPIFLSKIIDDMADSKGMLELAKNLGVPCESLCNSFTAIKNLSLTTAFKTLNDSGFRLALQSKEHSTTYTPKAIAV
jgi:probable addiction module antidote protein